MPPEMYEQAKAFVELKNKQPCQCGVATLNVHPSLLIAPSVVPKTTTMDPEGGLTIVAATCPGCSRITFFHAPAMGLAVIKGWDE